MRAQILGLVSLPVAVAERAHSGLCGSRAGVSDASIDFRGPSGTVREILLARARGTFPAVTLRGKIVMVGSPSRFSTTYTPPRPHADVRLEVQANAIQTVLRASRCAPRRAG